MRIACKIELDDKQKKLLQKLKRGRKVSVRLAQRARIVLMAAEGNMNKCIAAKLGIQALVRVPFGRAVLVLLVYLSRDVAGLAVIETRTVNGRISRYKVVRIEVVFVSLVSAGRNRHRVLLLARVVAASACDY